MAHRFAVGQDTMNIFAASDTDHGRGRKMIAAAERLLTLMIPTTESGSKLLPLPLLCDHHLRNLFELATYGFYNRRLAPQGWGVQNGKRLYCDISRQSPGIAAVLPGMVLDIRLRHPDPSGGGPRQIVIDNKYTSVTKPDRFRSETLSSNYVYQIYAYLMSQDAHEVGAKSEGLMLHPVVGGSLDEEVVIRGHRIRFATVDLATDSKNMACQFLRAVEEFVQS